MALHDLFTYEINEDKPCTRVRARVTDERTRYWPSRRETRLIEPPQGYVNTQFRQEKRENDELERAIKHLLVVFLLWLFEYALCARELAATARGLEREMRPGRTDLRASEKAMAGRRGAARVIYCFIHSPHPHICSSPCDKLYTRARHAWGCVLAEAGTMGSGAGTEWDLWGSGPCCWGRRRLCFRSGSGVV